MSQKSRTFADEINDEIMNDRVITLCDEILLRCSFYTELRANIQKEGNDLYPYLRSKHPKNWIKTFDWNNTSQGYDYWSKVNTAWKQLIERDNKQLISNYMSEKYANDYLPYLKYFIQEDEFYNLDTHGMIKTFQRCSFYHDLKEEFAKTSETISFSEWLTMNNPIEWFRFIRNDVEKWDKICKDWQSFCEPYKQRFLVNAKPYRYKKGEHAFIAIASYYNGKNIEANFSTTEINQAFFIKSRKAELKLNFKL